MALDSLDDFPEYLHELEGDSQRCIIRAAPREHVKPEMPVRRLSRDNAGDVATLGDAPSRLIIVDFDGVASGIDIAREPLRAAEHLRGLMPSEFRRSKCIFRASSSAGTKPGLHGWLIFASNEPITGAQAKRWLADVDCDKRIYTVTQPLFTARPIFEGMADPMSERVFLLEGGALVVVPQHVLECAVPPRKAPLYGEFWTPYERAAFAKWDRANGLSPETGERFVCPACDSDGACAMLDDGMLFCFANGHADRAPGVGSENDNGYVMTAFEAATKTPRDQVYNKLIELGLMGDWKTRWAEIAHRSAKSSAGSSERDAAAVVAAAERFSKDKKRAVKTIGDSPDKLGAITENLWREHGNHCEQKARDRLITDLADAAVFSGSGRGGVASIPLAVEIVQEAIKRSDAERATALDISDDGDVDADGLALPPEAEEYSDVGLAHRFAFVASHLVMYVTNDGWYEYDGRRWPRIEDYPSRILGQFLSELEQQLKRDGMEDLAKLVRSKKTHPQMRNLAELVKALPEVCVDPDDLDARAELLNCQNGTLDILTGELRPHDPADRITKTASVDYDPNATCPRFLETLAAYSRGDHAAPPDQEWINWQQHWLGYSLLGSIEGEYIVFYAGAGGNGKSTLMQTIATVLGGYAGSLPALAVEDSNAHSSVYGGLDRVRYLTTSEIDARKTLATVRLRAITGYEALRAQPGMARNFTSLTPRWKLTMSINGTPRLSEANRAMTRRLLVVPFAYSIPSESASTKRLDRALVETEGPGILAWLARGAQLMAARRWELPPCTAIAEATAEVFAANDSLAEWISDCCDRSASASESFAKLHASYLRWVDDAHVPGKDVLNMHAFGGKLSEQGFVRAKGAQGIAIRRGITLRRFPTNAARAAVQRSESAALRATGS